MGANLPLRLAGRAGRCGAVDRRTDLRLASGRVRVALDALGVGVAAVPAGTGRRADRELVGRADLGRAGRPARARPGRLAVDARPDHREERAADAQLRAEPDAVRAVVPGR